MKKINIIILISMIFLLSSSNSWMDDYQIKFGIIKKAGNGTMVLMRETKKIPLAIINHRDTYFGYRIDSNHSGDFSTYSVLYPPGTFQSPKYMREGAYIPQGRVSRKHYIFKCGILTHAFQPNDPSGKYKLIIYINNKPIRAIYFIAYDRKNNDYREF